MNTETKQPRRCPTIAQVEICADAIIASRNSGTVTGGSHETRPTEPNIIRDYCEQQNIFNSSVFGDCVIGTANKRWQESQIGWAH